LIYDQAECNIRCEWGEQGVLQLAPISDAVIIVDVLSFSTCVSIAVSRETLVFPYRGPQDEAADFARSVGAELAGRRDSARYSLSPVSLLRAPAGLRLVLPSPNGSALTLAAGPTPTFAGCLRNAGAVARAAMQRGGNIAVIPAGERWRTDGSLRPALEDLVGAGAILQHLRGSLSPEARLAVAAYHSVSETIGDAILRCSSGKELVMAGFEEDVVLSTAVEVDDCAPILREGAYRRA
jgi:2-phosphosulfolactate phosphatase